MQKQEQRQRVCRNKSKGNKVTFAQSCSAAALSQTSCDRPCSASRRAFSVRRRLSSAASTCRLSATSLSALAAFACTE